jgi:hypothetical protein
MKLAIALGLAMFTTSVSANDWDSSPNNWKNSPNNWENSPNNWQNSPHNWQNSPNKYGNDRIMRGVDGEPSGYVVPKNGGGVNFYDFEGNRRGYLP